MDRKLLFSAFALTLVSCFGGKGNPDDDTGPQGDPLQADLLFVLDNSPSMYDEVGTLGLGFDDLAASLPTDIDFHLAVTTLSADPEDDADGDGSLIEPGEVGTFMGVGAFTTSSDWTSELRRTMLCEGTCWPGECQGDDTDGCIPNDPSYQCDDDPGDQITWDYLECICGAGWEPPPCGSGNEEGLEAALLALCRATSSPPDSCFDHAGSPLTQADAGSNPGFLRPETPTVVLILTDEGDGSRVLSQGEDDPQEYLDLFQEIGGALSIAVVGPAYDPETHNFECNSGGATSWGTRRYQRSADITGGFYTSIEECNAPDGSCSGADSEYCAPTDFEGVWSSLVELLQAGASDVNGWW